MATIGPEKTAGFYMDAFEFILTWVEGQESLAVESSAGLQSEAL